jgi:hypothetical protein
VAENAARDFQPAFSRFGVDAPPLEREDLVKSVAQPVPAHHIPGADAPQPPDIPLDAPLIEERVGDQRGEA